MEIKIKIQSRNTNKIHIGNRYLKVLYIYFILVRVRTAVYTSLARFVGYQRRQYRFLLYTLFSLLLLLEIPMHIIVWGNENSKCSMYCTPTKCNAAKKMVATVNRENDFLIHMEILVLRQRAKFSRILNFYLKKKQAREI